MKKFLLFVPVLLLWACQSQPGQGSFPAESAIFGLKSPIQLKYQDQNVLEMRDFFPDPSGLDSVSCPDGLKCTLTADKETLVVTRTGQPALLSVFTFWYQKSPYTVLSRWPDKVDHTFTLADPEHQYSQVQVKGSFNGWNPSNTVLKFENGAWTASAQFDPGTYQFLFVADGVEMRDPLSTDSVPNGFGNWNTQLRIMPSVEGTPVHLFTSRIENGQIIVGMEGQEKELFVLWENHRLEGKYLRRQKGGEIMISLPDQAKTMPRSTLRVYALSEAGISNDLFIPLENGQPYKQITQVKRQDKHSQILYFLLVDRFLNGDPGNDAPLQDKRVFPRANYHGGDLAGVIKQIDIGFFSDLGVNTIWLSPISQNPLSAYQEFPEPRRWYSGYHGYWPISSSKVDTRFGTSDELKTLIEKAHQKKMNVVLDFVSNHVHQEHPLYQKHPEYATQLNLPDGRKNIRLWDEYRLTTWFDTFLPSLDFANPEVLELQSDSALFWAQNYELDGFRHDATKHIPTPFWRTLTRKLRNEVMIPQNRPFYQVGETFGSRELIGDYVGPGLMDGQFDFNLYFDARNAFANKTSSLNDLSRSLQESMNWYGSHSLMANITGNHDLARFMSLASGDLRWDEDDKEAGWQREIGVTDLNAYYRLRQLTAFIMTIPGVPVIYYGDEFGMPGAGDPDNRRPMLWDTDLDNDQYWLKNETRRLVNLRGFHLPLIYGDFQLLESSDSSLVYARTWFDECVVVAFNKSEKEEVIRFELPERFAGVQFLSNFKGDAMVNGRNVAARISPLGIEVFLGKK
ncbi:MAG: alpha-amylase [Bacteroidia bacterium]|nr:alpha-amylase [Bacteroidia bacterium]